MATSNLRSIVIKQTRNITEFISDANFRLLYNAIKEVVEYWNQLTVTQSEKTAYLQKYGLTKFIDITGNIKVNNLYIEELRYICEHVNGNRYDTEGSPDGLNIAPGYNLYISVSDLYMQACIVNTIHYNKSIQDGLTLTDLSTVQFAWTDYQYGNEDIPLCGNYINELLPYTNSALSEENRLNFLNNVPDYFIFPDQNDISQIRVYDFTPYYMYLADFYSKRSASEKYGIWMRYARYFCWPKLWSNIPGLATTCHPGRTIDEMWVYIPHRFDVAFSNHYWVMARENSDDATKGLWGHYTGEESRNAAKAWSEDTKRTTIDRMFMKCRGTYSNRPLGINGYVVNVNHMYYDCYTSMKTPTGGDREYFDPWGQPPTQILRIIVSQAWNQKPPVTFSSDEEAKAWLSNPSNIRWGDNSWYDQRDRAERPEEMRQFAVEAVYYTETDPEVIAGNHQVGEVKVPAGMVYDMYTFCYPWTIDYPVPCYVPDEWVPFWKYAKYVYKKDGTAPEGRRIYQETYVHSWTEYQSYGAPYYDAATGKYWWQKNTTLNTILAANEQADDPYGIYPT